VLRYDQLGLQSGGMIEWTLEVGVPVDCQLQAGGRPCSVCARSLSMVFADGVYDEAASDQRPAEPEDEPITLRVFDQVLSSYKPDGSVGSKPVLFAYNGCCLSVAADRRGRAVRHDERL
jgi:hypothetical protein